MEKTKYNYEDPEGLLGDFNQILISNLCKYNCFSEQGGCPANRNEEILDLKKIYSQANSILKKENGAKIALIAPSFFQLPNAYKILESLKDFDKFKPYLRIEDTVKHFSEKDKKYFEELRNKNIREIWTGIESGDENLRNSYRKPKFSNEELIDVTNKMKDADIRNGWYLVLGSDDTKETINKTKFLIEKVQPYRAWLTVATKYNQDRVDLKNLKKSIDKMLIFEEDLEKTMNAFCEGNKNGKNKIAKAK